jgi:hypothetical protein
MGSNYRERSWAIANSSSSSTIVAATAVAYRIIIVVDTADTRNHFVFSKVPHYYLVG